MTERRPAPVRRCVVIGDVHAEDERLDTALCWAARADVDLIACTGDVVDGRGSAARCCTLLNDHNALCVSGNHDRWLFTGLLRDRPGATQLATLSLQHQTFLKRLPVYREFDTPVGTVMLCHGVGKSDLEKITEFDTEYSLTHKKPLQAILALSKYSLMINGHSHCRLVLKVGSLTIVNAGALCHEHDPGFLWLDFERNLLRWQSIRNSLVVVAEERPII